MENLQNKTKKQLRKTMRHKRQSLTKFEQKKASMELKKNLNIFLRNKKWQKSAVYLSNDGEISMEFWIKNHVKNKQFYLPVVHRYLNGKLKFGQFSQQEKLVANKYNILQPNLKSAINFNCWSLDFIFLPLVAFDKNCNRMGMGAGFYDKTLARLNLPVAHKPKLIGIAHSLQEVDALPIQKWDITLDAIITDKRIFANKSKL